MSDPVLLDDWHPVATDAAVTAGALYAIRLLDADLVLWRDHTGAVRAWPDRCPHRGTRLSLGRVEDERVVCAYHGWRFDPNGRCTSVPAHPGWAVPEGLRIASCYVAVRYGLVWVCRGSPRKDVLPFPEYDDPILRRVVCGPYDVAASAPRVVENFLDMGHFPFVHPGILGDPTRTEVRDYEVGPWDDGTGHKGIRAAGCFFWQPQTNSLAHGGSEVEYSYRVVRPLTAILTKVPAAQSGFREAISLHVQPVEEEKSRAFIVLALTNFEQTEDELRAFQDRIFMQDAPILESQTPRRLPLAPGAERSVRSDKMSLAYRRYLQKAGLRYGVLREGGTA